MVAYVISCTQKSDRRKALSTIKKLLEKFNSKPIRNDMTYDDIKRISEYYGCIIKTGVNHSIRIVDMKSGTVIPIPCHGKYVKEAYIKELHSLFNMIDARDDKKGE